jgi:hypothetical protein
MNNKAGQRCDLTWRARRKRSAHAYLVFGVLFGTLMAFTETAQAVPSFSRQTGLECSSCHTSYPQLTSLGRTFKLQGYTLQSGDKQYYERLSAMLEPSFTNTEKGQSGGAAPHFGSNNNFALTQGSIFYGGRMVDSNDNLGAFVQVTYDGVSRDTSWDLTDFRWADNGTFGGKPVIYGFDLNNTPTVQDIWNTTPAWGFPFASSGLAPGPTAVTLIADPLGGSVAGMGAYAYWDNAVYFELNVYQTLQRNFLNAVGVNGLDQEINGGAPYWRLTLDHDFGAQHLEVGTFGLYADTYPGQDHSAGETNNYVDLGFDMQHEYSNQANYFTTRAAWIHEEQKLDASYALGGSDGLYNNLDTLALNTSYLYDQTYGATLAYNNIHGSSDTTLYGGSPDSDYYTVELDWMPLNKVAGPQAAYQTFNPKFSLQYVAYDKLDGTSDNASDNNTLYLQAWLVF